MKYYIGLDNGGTSVKAALYTANGEEVGVCSEYTQVCSVRPDFREQNMPDLWKINCRVLKKLITQTKADPANIAAIACCGHGKGLYLWGQNNKPVRNGILSTDNRAYEYPLKWEEDGTAQKVFSRSLQKILACQPVSLLAWLKQHEPESIEKIKWIFGCKDYIRYMLTGEAYAEITDCSGTNFLNLNTKQYDPNLLKLFDIEFAAAMLPPLRYSTDICGYVTEEAARLTGLKAGTPVAGGMFDIDACALAAGAISEDIICMIAGTWSINQYVRRKAVTNGSVMMNSLFCIPEYFLVEECSPTSAGNNEWIINVLFPELKVQAMEVKQSLYDLANAMAASISDNASCPIFLPFLMGSNAHPNAKACFIGINNFHTRSHILRSVYEGIAFSHRQHFEKLMTSRNSPVKEIRLAGGVTRSPVWLQIFADVMQYPIQTVQAAEAGTLGCAIAAAVAVGEYANMNEAAENMVKLGSRIEPNVANKSVYDKKYAQYKKIIAALDGIWDTMQAS